MTSLIFPALNLAILLGLLIYFLRSPLGKYVTTRREEIVAGLSRSKIQVLEAEAKRKEIEARFATLDSDKSVIFKEWKEREILQVKAIQESSERILAQMKKEADSNKIALEDFMNKDALNSAALYTIELTKKKMNERLNADSHRKINERFSQEVAGL